MLHSHKGEVAIVIRPLAAALTGLIVTAAVGASPASAAGAPSIKLVKASTTSIVSPELCTKKNRKATTIYFSFHVSGMRMSLHMNDKKPQPGLGHIQVYIDKVPADATRKFDRRYWLGSIPVSTLSMCFPRVFLGGKMGKHTVYFGLGKTNSHLYNVKPATFTFTARK